MKNTLHIRISRDMDLAIEKLVENGLFSSKGEVIREVIRNMLLKYKNEFSKNEKNN
ncbi:MAG TPA: hypothetical protein VI564_08020 [Candidatus Nanoarchaeia archaeon]|nr:hypothetical protein [Candidatus Nanoarchaeia archaeon]